jgi:ornithine carbamoyltransferase
MLVDIDDLSRAELRAVLDRAEQLRAAGETGSPLADQTLAMVFEKPSTRTRVSFETGMTQLGGHAIFLGPDDIHLGHGEPLRDTARVLSRYGEVLMARVFDHADVVELAEFATVPVINGLSDRAHPCQTLADLLTIRDQFGTLDVEVAWVGDGNNVCQSLTLGAAMTDLDLTIASPEGYEIDDDVRRRALGLDSPPAETTDPDAAIADADVVYTDVWVSMGEEEQRAEKLRAFEGFQVTAERLGDRPLLHCLPAHRGEEVTNEVMEGDHLAWDQAENRMHAQKGLLVWLAEQTTDERRVSDN